VPLNDSGLKGGLQELFEDAAKPRSVAPFDTAMAKGWAAAMKTHATAVVPMSTTVSAAAEKLGGALAGFAVAGKAAETLENAFKDFGDDVAKGMTPAFKGVGPAGKVGFSDVFSSTYKTAAAAADALTGKIDSWMKTGKANDAKTGAPAPDWK
jgi:hypothetical protein